MIKRVLLVTLVMLAFSSVGQSKSFYKAGDTLYYQNNRATYLKTNTRVVIKETNVNNNANSFKVEMYLLEPESKVFLLNSKFITNGLQQLKSNGIFTSYHKNGEKATEGETINGRKSGSLWTYFYKNGEKKSEEKLSEETFFNDNKVNLVMSFWDTKGNKTVENGNGFSQFVSDEDGYTYKGSYKNGLKNGDWIAFNGKVKVFEEVYKNGKLVKGTSWNDKQESFSYKKVFVKAYYKKQVTGYVKKYVSKKFNSNVITSTGNINISFDVSKEGKVGNVVIIKGLTQEHNSEVKRIITEMKDWVPAKKRGQTLSTKNSLNLNFN